MNDNQQQPAEVQILDKRFRRSYPNARIQADIRRMAQRLNRDYQEQPGPPPLVICLLNGVFMFAADLLKRLRFPCEVSFVKFASYQGTTSTGTVNQLIGLNASVRGRTVIVLDDIIETGATLQAIYDLLQPQQPKEFRVGALLFKPDCYRGQLPIDYVGRRIPNDFIVGYGLDYNGLGRNLPDIYTLIPTI